MKTSLFPLALLILAALSGGCSKLLTSDQPARQYYLLTPLTGQQAKPGTGPARPLSISVSVVPGLDTDRILAFSRDARLDHYANARWPDNLPEVLTSVMRRSLAASGRFDPVVAANVAMENGWLVSLEAQKFYGIRSDTSGTTSVSVQMAGRVSCNGLSQAFMLSESTRIGEERLSVIVAAHQAGLDGVTRQLLSKITEICD
jgi:ABC-type uncharacterized transport system auxiliary subunit